MDRRDFLKLSGAAAVSAVLPAVNLRAAEKGAEMASHYNGVSLLGYGCMRWPVVKDEQGREHVDQEQVNALVDEALRRGVSYFDAAPVYHGGECEKTTSVALNRHPRSEWLIATKLSNFSKWSYEDSVQMYRNSLSNFRTDHLDYYLLHSISSVSDFRKRFGDTGIMDFLLSERQKGHIRNLGFSFHGDLRTFEYMLSLHSKYHWDFVQIQMNYLDWTQEGTAAQLYRKLEEMDIPVAVMEPLRGGDLSTVPSPCARRLKAVDPDRSIASWAFRFVAGWPKVLTVLSGMTYMDHLQDNLDTFCNFVPLNEAQNEMLLEIAKEITSYSLIHCTGCRYCMPCPYGIDIPGIFRFHNRNVKNETFVRSSEQKRYSAMRRRYLADYDKSVESARQADHCIGCRKCVKTCPQHINIPEELGRIDKYIESLKRGTL